MKVNSISRIFTLCCAITAVCVPAIAQSPAKQSPANWNIYLSLKGASLGTTIGIDPRASDDDTGLGDMMQPDASWTGIYLLKYFQPGPDWTGRTGFSGIDWRFTPIPAGGSRTWMDLYLWAQNVTPTAANVGYFYSGLGYARPPTGYRGHLVLDYVPESCNWTGPMDYWVDLTTYTEMALPIPVTTDPLQGTRMHLTVYAPVPEPTSLAALATGLTAIGGFAIRRRKP